MPHYTCLLLYFLPRPTIASFEKQLILEHRLYVLEPYCGLKFALFVCCTVPLCCSRAEQWSDVVYCVPGHTSLYKNGPAPAHFTVAKHVYIRRLSIRWQKVSKWHPCVQLAPVPNGAVGLFSWFTHWWGSSSAAGLLFTALQRKRLPSSMWKNSTNVGSI